MYKKVILFFLIVNLLIFNFPLLTKAEDETISKEKAGFQLEEGDLILEIAKVKSFGLHQIERKKKIVTTGFEGKFSIIDARGTQKGWTLNVSSTPFEIVEPDNGWVESTTNYSLPFGSMKLNNVKSIDNVNTYSSKTQPDIAPLDIAIDLGQEIKVASAEEGKGMGAYEVEFNEEAISLVIDPATAKVDKRNYPKTITPYEATITWNLVTGPETAKKILPTNLEENI